MYKVICFVVEGMEEEAKGRGRDDGFRGRGVCISGYTYDRSNNNILGVSGILALLPIGRLKRGVDVSPLLGQAIEAHNH